MSKIDLHTHTTASDGQESPTQLVEQAKKRGIELLGVTDHDTTDGLKEARQKAEEQGIKFVNGIELSIQHYKDGKRYEFHLLGYGINPDNKALNEELGKQKKERLRRAKHIIEKLNEELPERITEEEAQKKMKEIEGAFGRPHLAEILIEKGIVKGKQEAFDKYLARLDVPKYKITLAEGAKLIREAGGKTVIAHPYAKSKASLRHIEPDIEKHEAIIEELREHLDGIESHYWDHTKEQEKKYEEIARKKNMIVTGGSDHHGGERDRLGKEEVPEYVKKFF